MSIGFAGTTKSVPHNGTLNSTVPLQTFSVVPRSSEEDDGRLGGPAVLV